MDKILITGGTGFFGLNFLKNITNNIYLLGNKKKLKKKHNQIFFLKKLNKENLIKFICLHKINVIIHAAAIADLEFAEKNKLITYNTNFKFTKTISDIARFLNLKLVFISTDQLYDSKSGYSKENQKIYTPNYYSLTKLLAEEYIKKNNKNFWIIRCSFFGCGTNYKKSLSDFIYLNLKQKKYINLWSNIFFNPINVSELIHISKNIFNFKSGIYNVGSFKKISKYEFAILLAKEFNLNIKYIKNINYENFNVKRPSDMSMNIDKISNIFNHLDFGIENQIKLLKNDFYNFRKELIKY